MGQFTFVAVALTLWATRSGQRASGAAALFAAIVLKTFPLVVLPALVRTRARRVLIGGLVAATTVLASSALGPRGDGHFALGMVDTMGAPHPRRREPVAGDLRDRDGVERSLDPNRHPVAPGGGCQRLGGLDGMACVRAARVRGARVLRDAPGVLRLVPARLGTPLLGSAPDLAWSHSSRCHAPRPEMTRQGGRLPWRRSCSRCPRRLRWPATHFSPGRPSHGC